MKTIQGMLGERLRQFSSLRKKVRGHKTNGAPNATANNDKSAPQVLYHINKQISRSCNKTSQLQQNWDLNWMHKDNFFYFMCVHESVILCQLGTIHSAPCSTVAPWRLMWFSNTRCPELMASSKQWVSAEWSMVNTAIHKGKNSK